MKMNRPKRTRLLILALLLVLLLTGCVDTSAETEPFIVTMMMEQFPVEAAPDGGEWIREIEQLTDTALQFQMIPTLEYVTQAERMIKNDRLPMILTVNETIMEKELFYSYLNAGGFWPLDEYLEDYPELKRFIGDEVWTNSQIQGHIYGIPRPRIRPRNGAYYRADWAWALGIEPPQTLDELYEMLKAFKEHDPDGNGRDDTVGVVSCWQNWGNRGWNGIQSLTTALGGPNGWEYSAAEGRMIPDFATGEYMEMLEWFRLLYREEIMENTFAFLTPVQRQERFTQGQVGMIFGVIDDAPELEDQLRRNNPSARLALLPMLEAAGDDYRVNSTKGYNGLIMFNRLGNGAIKTEEELRRILAVYNTLCGEAGQELLLFGKEGEHHVIESDGEKRLLFNDGNSRSNLSIYAGSYQQIMPTPAYVRMPGDSALQQIVYDCIEEREQWLVPDDADALHSETYSMVGDHLNEIIQKASIRYILGEITAADYWQAYEEWYDAGGKQVIAEYTLDFERWN